MAWNRHAIEQASMAWRACLISTLSGTSSGDRMSLRIFAWMRPSWRSFQCFERYAGTDAVGRADGQRDVVDFLDVAAIREKRRLASLARLQQVLVHGTHR